MTSRRRSSFSTFFLASFLLRTCHGGPDFFLEVPDDSDCEAAVGVDRCCDDDTSGFLFFFGLSGDGGAPRFVFLLPEPVFLLAAHKATTGWRSYV